MPGNVLTTVQPLSLVKVTVACLWWVCPHVASPTRQEHLTRLIPPSFLEQSTLVSWFPSTSVTAASPSPLEAPGLSGSLLSRDFLGAATVSNIAAPEVAGKRLQAVTHGDT